MVDLQVVQESVTGLSRVQFDVVANGGCPLDMLLVDVILVQLLLRQVLGAVVGSEIDVERRVTAVGCLWAEEEQDDDPDAEDDGADAICPVPADVLDDVAGYD